MLKTDELNADNSTKIYLDKSNLSLDTYAPLKRINKYKLKFNFKHWIIFRLQKSIYMKNKLLTIFINAKNPGREISPKLQKTLKLTIHPYEVK